MTAPSSGKYDGYSVNEGTDYDEFVVFRPNQIKSVDNIGTFDTSDPNIYRQTSDGQHRGSITFPRQAGQPIRISWSKNADASTVIHELARRGDFVAADSSAGTFLRRDRSIRRRQQTIWILYPTGGAKTQGR